MPVRLSYGGRQYCVVKSIMVRIVMSNATLLHGTIALFRPRHPTFLWYVFRSANRERMPSCM